MPSLSILAAMALALASIEGLAWWWMNPASTGPAQPVLTYQPKVGLDRRAGPLVPAERSEDGLVPAERSEDGLVPAERSEDGLVANGAQRQGTAQVDEARGSDASNQRPAINNRSEAKIAGGNQRSTINNQQSTIPSLPFFTPLPEIYDKAAPMLRCSSGQVCRVQLDESISLHLAFFEWNGTDTGSVLEAFRHMPEACMGSIGMQLVSKEKPISYMVGLDRENRNQRSADGSRENLKSQISNLKSPTLVFDHTIFREPGTHTNIFSPGPLVHAFRAVWVAGLTTADARQGLGGKEFNHLRTIRLKSALTRFRPAHARVIQGAVRGAPNSTAAWNAFQAAMLDDLSLE